MARALSAAVTGVVAMVAGAGPAGSMLPPQRSRLHYERPADYRPRPTQQELDAVMKSERAALRACYERAQLRVTDFADGSVALELNIGISGKVKHLRVTGPPAVRPLEPCFRDVVARWLFPQTSEEYGVRLPLVFPTQEEQEREARREREMCSLTISSAPWSEVWLDGKDTGRRTPVVDYKLPCGKHRLALKRPALRINHIKLIQLRREEPFDRSYTLRPRTAGRR